MLKRETIREKTVMYDTEEKNIKDGLKYLKETLSREEVKPFFLRAYEKGSAQFEDNKRKQFTLMYGGGKYILLARK